MTGITNERRAPDIECLRMHTRDIALFNKQISIGGSDRGCIAKGASGADATFRNPGALRSADFATNPNTMPLRHPVEMYHIFSCCEGTPSLPEDPDASENYR